MEITEINKVVKGKLSYSLDGKDKNSGTILGTLEDNKLFAVYTFTSEGVESKRDISFLIKDNQLIEGYGELHADGTSFVDKNNITYSSSFPLTKTDCNN